MKYILNIIHAIFLVLLLYWSSLIYQGLRIAAGRTFNPTSEVLFAGIFPIVIGIYTALPNLVAKTRRQGSWRFDESKIPILVVCLLLTLIQSLYMLTPIGRYAATSLLWAANFPQGCAIAGAVFGYLLLAAFRKVDIYDVPFNHANNGK